MDKKTQSYRKQGKFKRKKPHMAWPELAPLPDFKKQDGFERNIFHGSKLDDSCFSHKLKKYGQ